MKGLSDGPFASQVLGTIQQLPNHTESQSFPGAVNIMHQTFTLLFNINDKIRHPNYTSNDKKIHIPSFSDSKPFS